MFSKDIYIPLSKRLNDVELSLVSRYENDKALDDWDPCRSPTNHKKDHSWRSDLEKGIDRSYGFLHHIYNWKPSTTTSLRHIRP